MDGAGGISWEAIGSVLMGLILGSWRYYYQWRQRQRQQAATTLVQAVQTAQTVDPEREMPHWLQNMLDTIIDASKKTPRALIEVVIQMATRLAELEEVAVQIPQLQEQLRLKELELDALRTQHAKDMADQRNTYETRIADLEREVEGLKRQINSQLGDQRHA
jgi:predicted negative regulator of RcsB-dependent stress response